MSARPPLEAVLFDAGGTLVRLDFEWMSAWLAAEGHAVDWRVLRRCEVEGRRRFDESARFVHAVPHDPAAPHPPLGTRGDVGAYWGGMLEAAGVPPALRDRALGVFHHRQRHEGLWIRPAEGARAALDALPAMGLRIACVSNSDGRAEWHLVETGTREGLEFVVDSQLVGVEKPDPGIFRIALDRLRIAADRALYVGDIRCVDEAGARAAGLHFVLIDPFGDYAPAGGPAIPEISKLPDWIAANFTLSRRPAGGRAAVHDTSTVPSREAGERSGALGVSTPQIVIPSAWLARDRAMAEIEIPGAKTFRRGKVRSVFEAGPDHLLIVASDRLSAYDSVLPTPIPGKGAILSMISAFWMRTLASAKPHHLVSDAPADFPEPFRSHAAALAGRAQLVRRAERVDIECVVRGYLTGSGWKEYRQSGTVCGLALPPGLHDGSKLEPAIFTPATKNDDGHDENISFERMCAMVGRERAESLRARSIAIYEEARAHAWARGLVLADTKFEFGVIGGELVLIDEALTPDSSRYWDREAYEAGRLVSFDKQFVRDWLDRSGWNHEPPAPALPDDVVRRTQECYLEAIARLSGGPR